MSLWTGYVTASGDDVRCCPSVSGFNMTDTRQTFSMTPGSFHLVNRFQNITIPNGATITSAILQGQCSTTVTVSFTFTAKCEDIDSAPALSTLVDYTGRTMTSGTSIALASASYTSGTWYTIGDWGPEVQTVINRAGWASGNNLLIVGITTVFSSGAISYRSYDYTPGNAMQFDITYTTGGGTPGRIISKLW